MDKPLRRIAVTGAAGQIAYSLLFRLASGELFKDTPLELRLLEIPDAIQAAEGVRLELEDGAYPLLRKVVVTSRAEEAFDAVDVAILVGARPRGPGMERGELLAENAKIFVAQGQALEAVAADKVQVLVVGNPCNTNCLIALKQAKRLQPGQFQAMTRLDQNRAMGLLARQAGALVGDIGRVTIWGNHSATQVPDPYQATVGGKLLTGVITDRDWLEKDFVSTVQQRGAAIIAARGKSSAASAAQAILDHLRALYTPTKADDWFSMAVYSQGNPYGIDEDIVFSFPCRSRGEGDFTIVSDVPWNDFIRTKIAATEAELLEERRLYQGNTSWPS